MSSKIRRPVLRKNDTLMQASQQRGTAERQTEEDHNDSYQDIDMGE